LDKAAEEPHEEKAGAEEVLEVPTQTTTRPKTMQSKALIRMRRGAG